MPASPTKWVQYEWKTPVTTHEIAVFWWDYTKHATLPEAYHIEFWDGNNWLPVKIPPASASKTTSTTPLPSTK
ncbi:hypothetical protein ACQ86N_19200 [Puia sp. P3]|uniref:hypothetical protein n=1 Tax=Puia sp. P3 TaxID=3423952 RepID=UPI003D675A87